MLKAKRFYQTPEFWLNAYWIFIAVVYLAWRVFIFSKRML